MNTETTSNLCSTCDNENVDKLLKKYHINCSPHEIISKDSRQSFLKTFSILLNLTEDQLLATIANRRSDPQFIHLQKLEFGKAILTRLNHGPLVSNLAWICSLAEEFCRNIVVVCDFYCLNFIHNSKNIIIFNSSRRVRNTAPVGCLLFGFNTYHPIESTESISNILRIQTINRISYETPSVQMVNPDQVNDLQIEDRDILLVEETGVNELTLDDLGEPAFSSNTDTPQIHEGPTNSIRLNEFMIQNFEDSREENLNIESLTTSVKIDFNESSTNPENITFKKTHDIDGFFAFIDITEFGNTILCAAKYMIYPTLCDKRTLKNIKMMYVVPDDAFVHAFKIGSIELTIGTLEIIAVVKTNTELSDRTISEYSAAAANFARQLKCVEDVNHCQSCTSRDIIANHRSTRPSTSRYQGKQEAESYSARLSHCYIYHFNKELARKLGAGHRGEIKIFFKCIGCKASNFTENIYESFEVLSSLKSVFNFDCMNLKNIYLDFCITTSAETDHGPVILFCFEAFTNFFRPSCFGKAKNCRAG